MAITRLIDTNILVYRFDSRFPRKQQIATQLMRAGIMDGTARIAHQSIIEFVAAVTRPIRGHQIMSLPEAIEQAGGLTIQFDVLFPTAGLLRLALDGVRSLGLNWFDAHLWAYAAHFGLNEIVSEDFQHNRQYHGVKAVNPFIDAA